jgi:hypothetical protein
VDHLRREAERARDIERQARVLAKRQRDLKRQARQQVEQCLARSSVLAQRVASGVTTPDELVELQRLLAQANA